MSVDLESFSGTEILYKELVGFFIYTPAFVIPLVFDSGLPAQRLVLDTSLAQVTTEKG